MVNIVKCIVYYFSMTFNRLHFIRQVDLFTLRLFLSAIEEQQIGRAAFRENIAASTATKRIQDFEELLGIQLLERTPQGVRPTPAGEVVARYIRRVFGELDDMRAEIDSFNDGLRGQVFVAAPRSVLIPFLSRELGAFMRDYPKVEVVVRELENANVVQAVVNGDADIGVYALIPELDLSQVSVGLYRTDTMVVVVPEVHPLARRESVCFADIVNEDLVVVTAMHAALSIATRRAGAEYKPRFSVHTSGVAISLVQAGLGVTVQPECEVNVARLDGVVSIPLIDSWAKRLIQIATARQRNMNPAAQALLDQLKHQPVAS